MNILYQFNEKYVVYAGISLTSLLINNNDEEEINIYVLGEKLSYRSKEKLILLAKEYGRNIFFPNTDELIVKFMKMGMIPYRGAYSVYLRLFFSELLDINDGRILYLDADTIVDGSLKSLFEYDLKGKSVGMVVESLRSKYKTLIGMSEDSDYYNSGVILFDVGLWREKKYCEKIVEHIMNVRSSYIGDQDFINIVCEGDIFRLPIEFNYQPLHGRYSVSQYFSIYGCDNYYSDNEIKHAKENVVIYHCYRWLGDFPWNSGNFHPFNYIFDKYMVKSLWSTYKKEKSKRSIIILIEKLLYLLLPKRLFLCVFKFIHDMMINKAEKDAKIKKINNRV